MIKIEWLTIRILLVALATLNFQVHLYLAIES